MGKQFLAGRNRKEILAEILAEFDKRMANKKDRWKGCPYNVRLHEKRISGYPQNGINKDDYIYHRSRVDRSYDWLWEQEMKELRRLIFLRFHGTKRDRHVASEKVQ
jgi:hypothetical protein